MRAVRVGAAAAAALTVGIPTAAHAATSTDVGQLTSGAVSVPAPAGSAEAYALRVGNVAAISHTKASAGSSSQSSTANAVEVGGQPLLPMLGGTQSGPGTKSGALVDTGETPAGRLAVAPWSTSNAASPDSTSAQGSAAILLLDLGPSAAQLASVRLLQSDSQASWSPSASSGNSSSDGAIVDVGGSSGLMLDVLHSQAGSTSGASSYLLSVNGTEIGSSSQANGSCALSLPGLLSLNCLTASGGSGSSIGGPVTSVASVASATVGSGASSLSAGVVESRGTAAVSAHAPSSAPAGSPGGPAGTGAATSAIPAEVSAGRSAPSSGAQLPFTGADTLAEALASVLLAAAGTGLVLMSRARRPRHG